MTAKEKMDGRGGAITSSTELDGLHMEVDVVDDDALKKHPLL